MPDVVYSTDRRTDRRASLLNASALWGRGHNEVDKRDRCIRVMLPPSQKTSGQVSVLAYMITQKVVDRKISVKFSEATVTFWKISARLKRSRCQLQTNPDNHPLLCYAMFTLNDRQQLSVDRSYRQSFCRSTQKKSADMNGLVEKAAIVADLWRRRVDLSRFCVGSTCKSTWKFTPVSRFHKYLFLQAD